eukprot:scaffold26300_cov130-Isochrysis_galbana.AAC.3
MCKALARAELCSRRYSGFFDKLPCGIWYDVAAALYLHTEWNPPAVYRLKTPTRKGGVMCKRLWQ